MEPKTDEQYTQPIRITTVTQYAGDTSPPTLPAPPIQSSDWRVWVRWGVLVAITLAAAWLSQTKGEQTQDQVKEIKAEMKVMSAAHAARPVPVAAGQ